MRVSGDGINLSRGGAVAVANNYVANAIFNNQATLNSTVIAKSTAFTGQDSIVGTFSFWFKVDPTSAAGGVQSDVFQFGTANAFLIRRNITTNVLRIYAKNSDTAVVMDGVTTSNFSAAASAWNHVHIVWDFSGTGAVVIKINNVIESMTWTTNPNSVSETNIGFTAQGDGGVGITNNASGGSRFPGCIADVFLDQLVSHSSSNFIDGSGKPRDISALGSPQALLSEPAATYATNNGSGGNLTTTSALTDCASSPST